MTNNTELDHIEAIETLLERLLPLLIDASPKRADAIALLESWALKNDAEGVDNVLGEMAKAMLKPLGVPLD